VLPACAHKAACLVQPWELRRRGAACQLVPYCRDHPVRHRYRGVAEIAKAVHPDAARARHQDGLEAHCSYDIVAELHQPGACLAALRDERDSVARLKVRQRNAARQALSLQDVLLQARFPGLLRIAAARRDEAQK
jgi:hypothetical protein